MPSPHAQQVFDALVAPSGAAAALRAHVEPLIIQLGYALVRLRHHQGLGLRFRVQILAERPGPGCGMTLEDCARLSRAVSKHLRVHYGEVFQLEVSSPGLRRPLCREVDFCRWRGARVRVELRRPQGGRRVFTGCLGGVDGGRVLLEENGTRHAFAAETLRCAHVVVDDEAFEALLRRNVC